MSKTSLKILASVLGVGVGGCLLLFWYGNKPERRDTSQKEMFEARRKLGLLPAAGTAKSEPTAPNRPILIAVGSLGLGDDTQNGRVSDLLVANLTGAPGIRMIERQALEPILKELSLSLSGLVRASDAVRVGKIMRADWFLLGTPLSTPGTNFIVVRVVDARTGIFRDTSLVGADQSPGRVSQELNSFIRKCRADAATAKIPCYLAIGAFDDLSLNNRLAEFPTQLRAYLLEAYRDSGVTLLEREHVDTLLQELRLDLAGLTQGDGKDLPVMQSAVWLVQADYQSYESVRPEVEVALRISRIFGSSTTLPPIRAPLGKPLFSQIKASLDQTMNQHQAFPMVTLLSEVRAQMARGLDLAGFDGGWRWGGGYRELTQQEARMERRRFQEAIRAFQTVLLLDRSNREAKVYLAQCYCQDVIGRGNEGRELFREVLEQPVHDHWFHVVSDLLPGSFGFLAPEIRLNWFSAAERQSNNTNAQAVYHKYAEEAHQQMAELEGATMQPESIAEKKLRADISSGLAVLQGKSGYMNTDFGMSDYAYFFQPDEIKAGRKLAGLLPRLIFEFPMLAPHLTADALSYQRETNDPVLPEFQRQLASCREHPERVFALWDFWSRARYAAYDWCMEHGRADVATSILEGAKQAAQFTNSVSFDAQDNVALAFTFKAAGKWQQALAVFDSFSNIPIEMSRGSGPWGGAFLPVLPSKEVALCREKLGLPISSDPREFEMDTDGLPLGSAAAFATDPDGLWLACQDHLMRLDFGMRTNLVAVLPKDPAVGVTCLLVGPTNVWVGTDGEGIFEFNKATREVMHYGEKEGLMNDVVRTLCGADSSLWIGYGVKRPSMERLQFGGLGELNLATHQFRSFTPSLAGGSGALRHRLTGPVLKGPPRRIVSSLAYGRDGEVWFAASALCRFRSQDNAWDTFSQAGNCTTVAANSKLLVAGNFWNYEGQPAHGAASINVLDLARNTWSHINDFGVLPAGVVTALILDSDALWAGGMGFIAKINLQRNELQEYAYVRAYNVDQLQLGGGFVWAQYDNHLHRAKLP